MEEPIKEQSSISGNDGKSKLQRYPLRSAAKRKEEKAEPVNPSASRRARPPSALSKSMGVLDLSDKDKSAKPPRRLSIPAKSSASSNSKLARNITPISETRAQRSASSQPKSETDVSRSSSRRKFSVLSSASYWMQQIKLSETAAKHSISLGFFKLALEAGCEAQKMREVLISYAARHNLTELKETLKELFDVYNIVESVEQLQVSDTCSQVPEEGTKSSDEDVRSTSSTTGARKIKFKSLNNDATLASRVKAEPAKEGLKKSTVTKVRESGNKNSASSRNVPEIGAQRMQKKAQKPVKEEKKEVKRPGKKLATTEEGPGATPPTQDEIENKENLDTAPIAAVSAEVV